MRGPENSDRKRYIRLWPVWVAVGFPLLEIALDATPIAPNFAFVMLGLPALWLMWATSALCAAILTIRWLWRCDWRQAGICIVLPLVVLWAALNSSTYLRFCNNTGDAIHFYARYPAYENAVRAATGTGEPRLLTFNLGGMIWASRGFVFDESDELMKKPSTQSAEWRARAESSELSCGYGAVPMPGPSVFAEHWYIASFGC
jgi:hypothetical protein